MIRGMMEVMFGMFIEYLFVNFLEVLVLGYVNVERVIRFCLYLLYVSVRGWV